MFLGANGEPSVLEKTDRIEYPGGIAVYNFEIEGDHNYFVIANVEDYRNGANPVLVHNADYVDLTDFRKDHILNRHGAGRGKPGKTEFPANWGDEKVLHEISDVATDPTLIRQSGKWNGEFVEGMRDGINIHVDFFPPKLPTPPQNINRLSYKCTHKPIIYE